MIIKTLTELLHTDSDSFWTINKLLPKHSSVLLNDRDSLLAMQLALDVAGGKPFLGEYQTTLGKVLFIEKDKNRIKEHAQTLSRRPASTDNVTVMLLDPGDEREIVRVMKTENSMLTVLGNFPGSLDLLQFLTRVGPVIAITNGEHIGQLPVNDIWHLQSTEGGYRLVVKPVGLAINLSKQENGFVFNGEETWAPNAGPVWKVPTEKVIWRNQSIGGGVGGYIEKVN